MSLTAAQTKTLESLQQRAMKIIFPAVKDYTLSLIFANVDTLESRREQLSERFFRRRVLRKSSCLHYLLPDKRDSVITDRLRHPKTFKWLLMKTEKFRKSFYRTVLNIMISTAGANYALLTNCCRRHWTLALGSFDILLFYCILY